MENLEWFDAVDMVKKHIVQISTPRGTGTGFLITNNKHNMLCGVATAAHVVEHSHSWDEPIRIVHAESGITIQLRPHERAVFLDSNRDTAAVLFNRGDIPMPTQPLPLRPKGKYLRVGNEIAWLGFPAIPAANLCFFCGNISAWIDEQSAYLVDGVAISGVSGGPAFFRTGQVESPIALIGVVSAYVPNRAMGEALPGLSVIRDVKQFHELAPTFASLDQARDAESPGALPPEESSDGTE